MRLRAPEVQERLGLAFFLAAMVFVAYLSLARPIFNWDMIPYVALTVDRQGMNPAERHDLSYQLVHRAVPAKDWNLLTRSDQYRVAQYSNVNAFDSQLGMYRIKAGYLGLARLVSGRVNAIAALRLVNLLALAVLSFVALRWMYAGRFGRTAFFIVPVMVTAGLPFAAQLVTPDLLCVALAAAGLASIRRGTWWFAAVWLAGATLVRPDLIFFPAAWLVVAVWRRTDIKQSASCAVASALGYAVAVHGGDYLGWWPHFSTSLVARVDDLRTVPPFDLSVYLRAIARAGMANLSSQAWPMLVVLLAWCWLSLKAAPGRGRDQANVLFLALLLSLAARCIVFPIPDERLYLPTLVMLLLLTAERWGAAIDEADAAPVASLSRAGSDDQLAIAAVASTKLG